MVKYERYQTEGGKNLWRYSAYQGFDPKTGKKIQLRGRGFASRSEAKLTYERRIYQLQNESAAISKRMTFSELYKEFLVYYKDSGIKPSTYKKFIDESGRYVLPALKDFYIDKIDINDCQNIYDELKRKRKDHNKIVNQLERILDFAISKKYLSDNPAKNILRTRKKLYYAKRRLSSSENYYTPSQLMTFLEAFKEVEEYHKFVYFRLLAFTGLRRGEALALYESDIIRDSKAINVSKTLAENTDGKTYLSLFPKTEESANLVYLDDDTFEYIDKLIKDRNSYDYYGKVAYIHKNNILFPSPKTKTFYHRSAPNEWLRTFFERNEIELSKRGLHRISPHGLRHSQATLLYELGVNPKDAQSRLRHKNLKTTMDIYTHISDSRKRTPISKLDEFSSNGAISGATTLDQTENRS